MPYLIALLLLVTATGARAQPATVIDGDTLELAGERIRIWGIDAVEGNQICQRAGRPWRCGDDATAALEELVDGREIAAPRSIATATGAPWRHAWSAGTTSAPRWCDRDGRSTMSGTAAAGTLLSNSRPDRALLDTPCLQKPIDGRQLASALNAVARLERD